MRMGQYSPGVYKGHRAHPEQAYLAHQFEHLDEQTAP
jgi:hypothetical protein